jgi:hypothetical protein
MPKLPLMVDTQGRLRVSEVQRRDILGAWARSGESIPQFARRTGLKYSTLARWVQSSRRSQPARRSPRVRLLEAVIESPQKEGVGTLLVLELPGGARLEIRTEKQVELTAALLRTLAKAC